MNALEKNLQSLNETKDKLELDLSQGTLPWKIIKDPMVNPNPIKPEIQNLIYIILGTFSFASFLTYIVERFDDVFHTPYEIEKFIKLPIFGFVPFLSFQVNDFDEDEDEDKKEVQFQ